jgi:hypothetical protein
VGIVFTVFDPAQYFFALLHLLSRLVRSSPETGSVAERQHDASGVDPTLDNVLRGDTRNTCTDEFC